MKTIRLMLALISATLFAAVDIAKPIAELKLKDGRTLKNVTIVTFNASYVMAKWDGGRGTIRYEQMPDDLRAVMPNQRPNPAASPAITNFARGNPSSNR